MITLCSKWMFETTMTQEEISWEMYFSLFEASFEEFEVPEQENMRILYSHAHRPAFVGELPAGARDKWYSKRLVR